MTKKAEELQNLIDPTTPGQVAEPFEFPMACIYLDDRCLILSEKKSVRIENYTHSNTAPFEYVRRKYSEELDVMELLNELEGICRNIRAKMFLKTTSEN